MTLPKSLKRLGPLVGQHRSTIESAAGQPYAQHPTPDGGVSAQWSGPGRATFAISFDPAGRVVAVLVPGNLELPLSWRLRRLGNIIGMERSDVEAHLGPPNSMTAGAGHTLLAWVKPGYQVTIKFGPDDRCLGISHQHVAHPRR